MKMYLLKIYFHHIIVYFTIYKCIFTFFLLKIKMKGQQIQSYLTNMKNIQENILLYLEETDNIDIAFTDLVNRIQQTNYHLNKDEFASILSLLIKISKNYHRSTDFFSKLDRIFKYFETIIKGTFSNSELYRIVRKNKRVLLFLIKEGILTVDDNIAKQILYESENFAKFFYPEIKDFIHNEEILSELRKDIDDDHDFEQKRNEGENDNYICNLIRNDLVEDFVSHHTRSNFSLNNSISPSIFETNSFILNQIKKGKNPTLIEYAAFYGSISIFNYLRINEVELKPSIWNYAVHSKNAALIHLIEEQKVEPESKYVKCLLNSIKYFNNDLTEYFLNNQLKGIIPTEIIYQLGTDKYKQIQVIDRDSCLFKYQNFNYMDNLNIDDQLTLWLSCKYNYLYIAKYMLNHQGLNVDVNAYSFDELWNNNFFLTLEKYTPLCIAAKKGNLEIIQILASVKEIKINKQVVFNNECYFIHEISIFFFFFI